MGDAAQDSASKVETKKFIFEETEYRFQLAGDALISKTKLLEQREYPLDTQITQQLIEGKFDISDDIDDVTALILEEIGRVGVQVFNGNVAIDISSDEFQYFWRRIKEGTESSISGIHYDHYKAVAHSYRISGFLAKKLTLVAQTGCPSERWSYGLTVMLENIAEIALVNKLCAILLM